MRFGILSQWYAPEPGPASLPEVLARQLAARGHEVRIVTGFPNYPTGELFPGYKIQRKLDEQGAAGISIRRVALYPAHDNSISSRFLNYSSFALSAAVSGIGQLRDVDAFWVYNSPTTIGLPSALATAAGGPPHLMHVMDLWPDTIRLSGLTNASSYRMAEQTLERWCKWTYRRAAAIACISQAVLTELLARGVPPRKLHHIPIWADEDLYYPRARPLRLAAQLGVENKFTLMYAGNLGEAQGLTALLEVCARLSDLEDFHCLVVGTGVAEAQLRRRAQELRLRNTTFTGRRSPEEMGDILSVGDLHLLSLNGDPLSAMTLPSKLPPILASERAVLASATGESARIVREADAGWTVRPGDIDSFERSVREAHTAGRAGLARRGRAARAYYEHRLALAIGVDAVERLLTNVAAAGRAKSRHLPSGRSL